MKAIGISYNLYQSQKIEIRLDDGLFITSDDLVNFYINQQDKTNHVDKIVFNQPYLTIDALSEHFKYRSDDDNILTIWSKFFTNIAPISIQKYDTSFDVLITDIGIQNLRLYQNLQNSQTSFVDFVWCENAYTILTYRPFQKRTLKSIDFNHEQWTLFLDDETQIKVDVNISKLFDELLKHYFCD